MINQCRSNASGHYIKIIKTQQNQDKMIGCKKNITISRAQAVGKAARRLPPKSSHAEMHITGGARLTPLARTEYLIASYI